MTTTNLTEYVNTYGGILGRQAAESMEPLHDPQTMPHADFGSLLRKPYAAQAHVATAMAAQMRRNRSVWCIAEPGTGKSMMALSSIHSHAAGRPYRALVMCPPHLVGKWLREIEETIANVKATEIEGVRSLAMMQMFRTPYTAEWWVCSQSKAKLGPPWVPAYIRRKADGRTGVLRCPDCGDTLTKTVKAKSDGPAASYDPLTVEDLGKRRSYCAECRAPLYQWTSDIKRWPVATYIKRKLRGCFQYFVCDEAHEEKSDTSAQAMAMGELASAIPTNMMLTGTLIGGYAEHLRSLLFRTCPRSLISDGFTWANKGAFNEAYGRIERVVTVKNGREVDDHRQSRGKGNRTSERVVPGVMPTIFGHHLLEQCVFLGLEDVADNLPPYSETVIPVTMDAELAAAYASLESDLVAAVRSLMRSGRGRRLLGALLQTLLGYPDQPWGWGEVGYFDADEAGMKEWVAVTTPEDLPPSVVRNKERQLIEEVLLPEIRQGRQVWVYCTMTGKRDVASRLQELIQNAGMRCAVLRASVSTRSREEWIARTAPSNQVVISHPQLVQTGMDLFDKKGKYNFPSLVFYETGYNLFTLRQASRRAWRLGQHAECRTYYMYYAATMQERAMTLMGRKLVASGAIEGKFSADGLAAMAGDDLGIEHALAKSLAERLDDLGAKEVWCPPAAPASPLLRETVATAAPLVRTDAGVSGRLFASDEMPAVKHIQKRLFE